MLMRTTSQLKTKIIMRPWAKDMVYEKDYSPLTINTIARLYVQDMVWRKSWIELRLLRTDYLGRTTGWPINPLPST